MRTGRLSMPVEEYWANRRIERSADGSYAQSETGGVMASLEAVDYTGSFRSERDSECCSGAEWSSAARTPEGRTTQIFSTQV